MMVQFGHSTKRLFIIWAALAITITLLAAPALAEQAQSAPLSRQDLIAALQDGGHVLIIRHERTEVPSRADDYTQAPDDCRAQRNLSIAGAAGAQETGVVLRALDIDVSRVISSPMCRSAETARFMFGVDYENDVRLMHHNPRGARTLDIAETELRRVLAELAPGLPGSNIALISHGGNIFRVSGLRLSEGEIGVLRYTDTGAVTAVGQFMGSDLAPFARRALGDVD